MRLINKYIVLLSVILWSASTQAMTLWVVESGQNPFMNSQATLTLSAGTSTLDLYYDVAGDTSYGYDFILDITGIASITNVGGGDSGSGSVFNTGWRQFGGNILGESGSSVLAFSFDFSADAGASLSASGTYTDANFLDAVIPSSTLITVAAVPIPAAMWLFGSGLLGLVGVARRHSANI